VPTILRDAMMCDADRPFSGSKNKSSKQSVRIEHEIYLEDGGSTFFRNICRVLPNHTASHLRRSLDCDHCKTLKSSKLRNNWHSSDSIVAMITTRRMVSPRYIPVRRTCEKYLNPHAKFYSEILKVGSALRRLRLNGRIRLKLILQKQSLNVRTPWSPLMVGSNIGLIWARRWSYRIHWTRYFRTGRAAIRFLRNDLHYYLVV
jgi:hypothetical protein